MFVRDSTARLEPAGECAVNAGIVGHANLLLGDAVDEVLQAHLEEGRGRFKGVRHSGAWHASDAITGSHTNPPEGLLLDPGFRKGFAHLEALSLCFDAWLYHTQLSDLADLARAFPGVTIVLDHFGGPLFFWWTRFRFPMGMILVVMVMMERVNCWMVMFWWMVMIWGSDVRCT